MSLLQLKTTHSNPTPRLRAQAEKTPKSTFAPSDKQNQVVDKVQLSASPTKTSKEAALHFAVTGAAVVGALTTAATIATFGAAAGSAGLAVLGISLATGAVGALVGGAVNGAKGLFSAKGKNPETLQKIGNATNYGVSAAVIGTVAVGAIALQAVNGQGAEFAPLLAAPVAGAVAGVVNAVRGWNLRA